MCERMGVEGFLVREITDKDSSPGIEPGKWLGSATYYIILLFVLVAFFQALGLTIVAGPINLILDQLSGFAPRLLAAAALFVIAWVIARLARTIIGGILKSANADKWLKDSAEISDTRKFSISETVASATYWLVFVLFLPAILDALQLTGLLVPVEGMMNEALGFLPNLFASVLILAVGWFAARVIRHITVNLLSTVGVNAISDRVGLGVILGKHTFADLIGLLVYALLLIPIAIAALDALQISSISGPASQMLQSIFHAFPAMVSASLVLFIAFLAGRFVAGLVSDLLAKVGFNAVLSWLGIGQVPEEGLPTPSDVVGNIVLAAILLFASIEASRSLGFDAFAQILMNFVAFAGQVVLGLIIFALGLFLANLAAQALSKQSTVEGKVLPLAARISIIALATAMGLQQMGLADEIIAIAFALSLGTVAVSVALAFGLGTREIAAEEVDRWLKKLRSKK